MPGPKSFPLRLFGAFSLSLISPVTANRPVGGQWGGPSFLVVCLLTSQIPFTTYFANRINHLTHPSNTSCFILELGVSVSSLRRIIASRANGARSRGPVTAGGKQTSRNLLLMRLSPPPDPVDPSACEPDTLDIPNEPSPISEHLAPPEVPNEPNPISEHLAPLDMPNEPNPISEHLAPLDMPNEPNPISEHLAPPEIPNEPNPISEHQMPSRPAEPGR